MIIGGIRWKRINGITLIALVITIIIIVILAAVTLSFIFNGGVLDKACLLYTSFKVKRRKVKVGNNK